MLWHKGNPVNGVIKMPNEVDIVFLIQALLDHCDELRKEIIQLRKSAGLIDVYSDLVLDIRDNPAYITYKDYLDLHYD